MELFKFRNDGPSPDYLDYGTPINGIKTARWVERFREAGEFEITANVSSNLREDLPIGSIISHVDTLEAMMVENHEIDEDVEDGEPQIVMSGRSLDAWLEQRVVGQDIEHYAGLILNYIPYVLAFDTSWAQVVALITHHINDEFNNTTDNISGIVAISNQQHIGSSTTAERIIESKNLYRAVMDLLVVDDFGIRVVRPNPANVDPTTCEFRIHNGFDLSESVIFSHAVGDLDRARYFWSDKTLKTDYYCTSTYLAVRSTSASVGFNRRVLHVDCTDIDQHLDIDDITGGADADVGAAMYARGEAAMRANIAKSILSTDISRTTQYEYRRDYNVGDLVTVNGNYDIESIMRVAEHVEFLDESGESGYPTLAAVNEGT